MLNYCNDVSTNLSSYSGLSRNDSAVIITTVSCCLSICGACGIFWTYLMMKEIRKFVRSLMVFLTIADFLTASGYILAAMRHFFVEDDKISCEMCIAQSFITTYSSIASFFLTMIIALHMFLTIYNRKPITGTTKFMYLFNGISWITPGIIVAIAFSSNALGQDVNPSSQAGTGPWCWIRIERDSANGGLPGSAVLWMMVAGKGWEIMCYLVTTSLYVLLKLHLHLKHNSRQFQDIHDSLRHEDKNYIFVFLVLWAVRMWGTIRFLMSLLHVPSSSKSMEVLEKIQAFGDPSQAFFNFCLFCLLDGTVRRRMFACCRKSNASSPLIINDHAHINYQSRGMTPPI